MYTKKNVNVHVQWNTQIRNYFPHRIDFQLIIIIFIFLIKKKGMLF